MSTSPRRGGGLHAFRLGDIPEPIRRRALARLLSGSDPKLPTVASFSDRVQLGLVAEKPSDRTYWVSRPAWERVMLPKNRRRP